MKKKRKAPKEKRPSRVGARPEKGRLEARGNAGAESKAQEKPSSMGPVAKASATLWKSIAAHPWITVLATGLLFSWAIHFVSLTPLVPKGGDRYEENGLPLMTTLDGYYYMRLTSDLLEDRYRQRDEKRPEGSRPFPVPLIVRILALLQRLTGARLETLAFYLPPLLASLLVPLYVLWGRALGSPLTALLASLAGASSFYWYSRSSLGRFDTDCLNPVLPFLIVYLMYRFCTDSGLRRPLFLVLALTVAWVYSLWWVQIRPLGIFFILSAYGLSVVLPSSLWERVFKGILVAAGAVVGASVLFGFYQHFPDAAARPLRSVAAHLELVSKHAGAAFPEVGQSIKELQADSLLELAVKAAGNPMSFLLSLTGLGFLVLRHRAVGVFLAPLLFLGILSVLSRRFLIFLVPVYALCLGYALAQVIGKSEALWKNSRPWVKNAGLAIMAFVVLGGGLYYCLITPLSVAVTPGQAALARAIDQRSSPDAVVWNWWDDGYPLQYLARRQTFGDGGSQLPMRVFVTAFPLSCHDPVLARHWIRFFAKQNVAGFHRIRSQLGTWKRSLRFLEKVFSNPANAPAILTRYGMEPVSSWMEYLFPPGEVCLYLTQDFVNKAHWWYYFATWDFASREGVHGRIMRTDRYELLEEGDGVFRTGSGGYLRIGRMVRVDGQGVREEILNPDFSTSAVEVEGDPSLIVVDEDLFGSLTFLLLFRNPRDLPGFEPLEYDPATGGVWKVL